MIFTMKNAHFFFEKFIIFVVYQEGYGVLTNWTSLNCMKILKMSITHLEDDTFHGDLI